jgi:hypothetical protein
MILRIAPSGIVNLKVIILLIMSGFAYLTGVSQNFSRVNLKEIPQRKVRKYIESRSIDKMNEFSSIHASWKKNIDESDFRFMEKTFYLKYKLLDVWECYRYSDPFKMWNGRSVRFGLLISKYSNSVIYSNSYSFPEIDTGHVYFLNIRFVKGLFNIPVAFEIINIDREQHIMEISYIENNKSRGKQTIQFFDNGEGCTRIVHSSYFKSESALRDDLLYPYFHNKFIKEFHGNMRKLIKNKELTIPILN